MTFWVCLLRDRERQRETEGDRERETERDNVDSKKRHYEYKLDKRVKCFKV